MIMCCANSILCLCVVETLLEHCLKDTKKGLFCCHKKLDTLKWYNAHLPEIKVSVQHIHELKDLNKEKDHLSFDFFPCHVKNAISLTIVTQPGLDLIH
jgi:hypothetical protein